MLEALKFVMRSVARRDYVPGLTHFRIVNQRCTGYNGVLAISAPVDIGFDVAPKAGEFMRALGACEDVITLKMDGPSSLLVRSGAFKVSVPCIPLESVPEMLPEGRLLHPHESLLGAFEVLFPFIGIDASRPWAMGILLANQSAFATNNIVLTEYWLGAPFPALVNIPSVIVEEVTRVGEELVSIQVSDSSVTFHYSDGRWIKSPVLALSWPDAPTALKSSWADPHLEPVRDDIRTACEKLAPFASPHAEYLFFRGTDISTTIKGVEDGGAVFELPNLPAKGCYHIKHLNAVLAAATHIDLTKYPAPIPFHGGQLRGAMLGVRS